MFFFKCDTTRTFCLKYGVSRSIFGMEWTSWCHLRRLFYLYSTGGKLICGGSFRVMEFWGWIYVLGVGFCDDTQICFSRLWIFTSMYGALMKR